MFMAEASPMQIRTIELCTEIHGYGQYQLAHSDHLKSENEILVYCEVENLASKPFRHEDTDYFETRVQGQVQILDEQGKEVARYDFDPVNDQSRRIRRDYFVFFPFRIPQLREGRYRVIARLVDLNRQDAIATNESPLLVR